MAKGYLIDTSAVIKYLNQTFPAKAISFINEIIDSESNISFIFEIELQVWNPSNPKDIDVYLQFCTGIQCIWHKPGNHCFNNPDKEKSQIKISRCINSRYSYRK
jgi:hypothetical protein